ncbi:MAG: hypothetical protein MJ171_00625 [Clostridia bacterium]|nr:hypothetical protein [Clostridia bacterium]
MAKYEKLTKFIPVMDSDEFGEWEENGDLRYVAYHDFVYRFFDIVVDMTEDEKYYTQEGVEEILDECGIYMMDGMTYLDIPVDSLSGDAVLVFLNLIQREEMEEGGVILSLLEDRVILKWLERLEELDRMEA